MNMEQVIATMLILGLVVGFCGGYFYGSWATERQHQIERKMRDDITAMAKAARIDNQHRRVAIICLPAKN